MHSLIITAHPSTQGFIHKAANRYLETRRSLGHSAEIMNLYNAEWRQDFLAFENIKEFPVDPVREKIQEKILVADELIFCFPIWWIGAPAILKNFLDCNLTAGYAYKYIKGSRVPRGLLKGRTARIFITCDGFWWFYKLVPFNIWLVWQLGILGLCGIKIKSFDILDRKRWRNEVHMEKFLKKVEKRAR